ncbi:MAG: DEAD/DEAH box helicase [Pseudomonadota bacterium]
MLFSELGLDPKVLQAVEEAGYPEPTPIQAEAIPHALNGRDVLGIAQTGTGKTASFTLPMITALSKGRARARMPRSLILCPTRELAAQVAENFEKYGKNVKLSMALLIGGVNFKEQDKAIDRGVDVLIATPGRLIDHFERGKLMLTGIQVMVVDEADRMLDMGFIPDIEKIFNLTPFTRQTLFFSATMPPEITRLTETFLHNPVRVEVARQSTTAETVTQGVCLFRARRKESAAKEKRECLRGIIESEGAKLRNAIIFCNRKRDVSVLHKSLSKHGYNAGALHGDLDQSVRTATLQGFRDGEIKLLVASDVAARGLDIPDVSHVFNFDVPTHSEDYVHRIGRTGRAGKEGVAITISTPPEAKYLEGIEKLIAREIPRLSIGDAPAEPEVQAAPAEEPKRPRRSSAPKDRTEPRTEQPRTEQPPKQRGRGRRGGNEQNTVVGMGDHVPAFLLRPVRAAETTESDDTPEDDGGSAGQANAA